MYNFDKFFKEIEKEQLKNNRIQEQKDNKDYSYDEVNKLEICNKCKSYINSHGHCPLCDY